MRSMEMEYEAAKESVLPCFPFFLPAAGNDDEAMVAFRKLVMENGIEFLTTPKALYKDLLNQLRGLQPKVFISYSSKDQEFVDTLSSSLKKSGYYPWKNTESIPKGEDWHAEMINGLAGTDILILILSPEALESKYVKEEWSSFLNENKKVLPVLLKDCKLPKKLSKIEMIKASNDDWYSKLLKAIEQNLQPTTG